MDKQFDVVALGEYLIDFSPTGHTATANPLYEMNPGGAPTNCLASCAALGGNTAIIGAVGNDFFGRFLKEKATEAEIDISGLQTVPDSTTLVFVSIDDEGNREFAFVRQPGADTRISRAALNTRLLENTSYLHFGTLSLTDEPARDTTVFAVEYAKRHGARISFDPNYRAPLWKSEDEAKAWMLWGIEHADTVKMSEEELEMLFGKDIGEAAKEVLDLGVEELYITAGSKGAYFFSKSEKLYDPGFAVNAIDTTGCGDAFAGAILYQKCRETGRGAKERLRFANAVGALCATHLGGMSAMPGRESVEQLLERSGSCI